MKDEKRTLELGMCLLMLDEARKAAAKMEKTVAIAIVDADAQLKAFERIDGALICANTLSVKKAETSAAWGYSTKVLMLYMGGDSILSGVLPYFTEPPLLLPGGYPIMLGDRLLGGIGVSGAHYDEDHKIALEAVERFKAYYSDQRFTRTP